MVQECYSPERPARVLCFRRDGRTEVRLRRNIAEDESDGGVAFWRCEESAFTVPGSMTEDEAEARFDELWEEHEDDGKTAAEVAREAKAAARTPDPGLAAVAKLAVRATDFSSVTATEVVSVGDYVPEWSEVEHFRHNQPCRYKGKLYRASKEHDRQEVYPPDVAGESMYYPIEVAPDGIIVYRTCHGDYDMVHKGEKRHYPDAEGPVYEALKDTSYSPDAYPQHWRAV